ncbi:uncharacterized protein LOC123532414 [Mercenaria mercenaria]|uniref:uncharacterized protein LOC123532414 n=1 Tax=Mercenaria mercenaria TaxID=6596 RepID=UPI00234EC9AA|nr:uncharacterized protein LOC123532414 [Mercenaria mercenaria]
MFEMALKCTVFLVLFLYNVLVADCKKRLVLEEMDIEQEIINLKTSMAQKDAEIAALQKQNADLQLQMGSLYTRWGRTSCPGNGTTLAYSGYMAGTYHDTVGHGPGPGSNYLCLADQPTWDYYSDTANNIIHITGVEYEFHATNPHDIQSIFGSDIQDSDAPCSVCRTQRNTNVMIPGRKDCYPGWTKEYSGYLVGGSPNYDDSTEYICLDRRPETVVHSGISYNDNMLYFVEAFCGKSLECPPYEHNRELACVVCSM